MYGKAPTTNSDHNNAHHDYHNHHHPHLGPQVCVTVIEARQLGGLNMDPVVCVQVQSRQQNKDEGKKQFVSIHS